MAKPNYQFEKRQRELEKKKAEKALRKANASESAAPEVAHEAPTEEAVPAK